MSNNWFVLVLFYFNGLASISFSELAVETVKPYKVNERIVNQAVVLKHGKSTKIFNMDRISNAQFTDVRICRSLVLTIFLKLDTI